MRVLVPVNDAFGHVLPLVPTVHALARRGHDVLLACPGPTARVAAHRGVEVRVYEPEPLPPVAPAPPRPAWAAGWPGRSTPPGPTRPAAGSGRSS